MIDNLIRLYIYESFTLIAFVILGILASVMQLGYILAVIGIFIMLVFIVWVVTSRLILKLLVDGIINEDRRNKDGKRNSKED